MVTASSRGLRLAALLLALSGPSCERAEQHSWPLGTVLAVDGQPFTAAEIDLVADRLGELRPDYTRPHLRRLALTAVVIPSRVAQRLAPDRRQRQLRAAQACRERLISGQPPDPELGVVEVERSGNWFQLGIILGPTVSDLPVGEWSPVTDSLGIWFSARVLQREVGETPIETELRVALIEFPYLEDNRATIDEALADTTYTLVDPAWREILPELWLSRMRVEGSFE